MGPISKKVIAGFKKAKNQKIIDFKELKEAKTYAQGLDKTVISEDQLSKYDPLHAVYIYAQNKVSVLVEQLSNLPALSKLTDNLEQADDIYLPSSPPRSPLTQSYFTCWGFFDLCVGIKKESFGTVIIDLLKNIKADQGLIKIIEYMQNSRMGIFIHRGNIDRYVILEELITGEEVKVFVPAGYQGKENEIWYVRLMPAPFPELNYGYSVAFTTPYILIDLDGDIGSSAKRDDWEAFFARNLKAVREKDKIKTYDSFMKYGKNKHFWNEYIFEGYVNYEADMIMLAGIPDIPLSMPHSEASQRERGEI
ncbi:MAG: hypothetical protein KKE44_20885 [Proteobacteria bacterium]|nr:hypothetical protein [Pseudomonadota bacterium]MBU1585188.1 hypothetical protein [Pseudomonadota bacterium]MBU2454501.1 hypothetical protein [Pseudomonadota bacterium]MBU2629078.1 hypothetical protein [Pseudomonadota bacterium]